jgi:hypothetical protein
VFYIPALGLHAGLEPSAIFAFNGIVVAGFVLLAGWLTMYRRFRLPVALVMLVFLWLLIVVPMGSGNGFRDVSWAMYYNRHCWAALAVMMLFYVRPESLKPHDKWLDSFVLASLAIFLIYTKITFALVGVAFIVANMFTQRYNRIVSVISFPIIALVMGSIEIIHGYHTAYFNDIFATATGNPIFRDGKWGFLEIFIEHAWIFIACAAALFATLLAGRRCWLDWAFVFSLVSVSVVLLATTGGMGKGMPTLIAIFVCCGELARRAENQRESKVVSSDWRIHAGSLACMLLVMMFVIEPLGNRVVAWHDHYAKTTRGILKPLPGLPAKLSGFLVKENASNHQDIYGHNEEGHSLLTRVRNISPTTLSPHEYLLTIVEGYELLRTTVSEDSSLFVFDNADPFSVALNMRPTENGYPLFWTYLYFSEENSPSGQEILYNVDFVMVPIVPHEIHTLRTMQKIYGDYLGQEYIELKRSPHWRLLALK